MSSAQWKDNHDENHAFRSSKDHLPRYTLFDSVENSLQLLDSVIFYFVIQSVHRIEVNLVTLNTF